MRATAIAWAAGLFEGEGSIGTFRTKVRRSETPRLQLSMTDEDVVRRFHAVTSIGAVYGPYRRSVVKRPILIWICTGFEHVQALLAMFWPWLGARRRARAKEILTKAKAHRPAPRHKPSCLRGHPLHGDNVYVAPSGDRVCRTCARVRTRAWFAKNPGYRAAYERRRRERS